MTSTSFNVGLADTSRSSSKVLKPPGGGSSDIFGTSTAQSVEQSPKRRTNHMQSSLFVESGPVSATPTRSKPGNDTFNRLFGEVPSKPATPFTLASKSNLGFGEQLDNAPSTNNISRCQDGSKENGINETASVANGNDAANANTNIDANTNPTNGANANTQGTAQAQRTRVPPGGFSSGLW